MAKKIKTEKLIKKGYIEIAKDSKKIAKEWINTKIEIN
jgi:hypothetical protein